MDSETLRNELLTSQWSGFSPGNISYTGGNVNVTNTLTAGNVGIGTTGPGYPLEVNDITTGLITRVNFNGSVVDEKGNVSFTQGNGALSYVAGQIGPAGNFNGNTTASTPNQWYYSSPPVSQPPFSFCFWFNPQSTSWYGTIMGLSNGSNFTYMNVDYGTLVNANNALYFFLDLNTQWAIAGATLNTGALTLGTWYHVCVTVTSAWVATCYVNGSQVSTQTGTGNFPTAPTRFIIGGNGDGTVGGVPSRGANFFIDDLRWYNRFISTTELASIYSLNSLYSAKNLVVNGSVGIGSSAPQYPLDISGTIRFTNYGFRFTTASGLVSITNNAPVPFTVADPNLPYQTITSSGFLTPVAGLWSFTSMLSLDNNTTTSSFRVGIGITSTNTTSINYSGAGSMDTLTWFRSVLPQEQYQAALFSGTLSCVYYCPINTYIKVFVSASTPNSSTGVRTYSWSNPVCFLSGYLISN